MSMEEATMGAASSSKRVLDEVDLSLDDCSESKFSGAPVQPRPKARHGGRSQSEFTAELAKLVEAAESSDVGWRQLSVDDWHQIEDKIGVNGCRARWADIQNDLEMDCRWEPLAFASDLAGPDDSRRASDEEGDESSSDEDQVAVRTSGRVRRQDAPKSRAPVPPVRTSRGKNWTTVEEYLLRRVVESYAGEGIDWSAVDLKVGRTSCQARWKVIQKRSESSRPRPGLHHARWKPGHREQLRRFVEGSKGDVDYDVAARLLGRSSAACRAQALALGYVALGPSGGQPRSKASKLNRNHSPSPVPSSRSSASRGSEESVPIDAKVRATPSPIDPRVLPATNPSVDLDAPTLDPAAVAHYAAIAAMEQDVASSLAAVVALEARNQRMQEAQDSMIELNRRMASARDEERRLKAREVLSSGGMEQNDRRIASGSMGNLSRRPPTPLAAIVDPLASQAFPATSISNDVQHRPSPPAASASIFVPTPSPAPRQLIELESDSSDEDSDDIDEE